MILPPFKLHRPATLREALDMSGECDGDFDYIGGGTDLLPNYKNRLNPRRNVIALWGIDALREHRPGSLGAMTRLADMEADPAADGGAPGLIDAVREVATPLIRRQATIGGNMLVETRCYYFNQSRDWRASKGYCMKADGDVCLVVPQKESCYAVYSGDSAPVLMALDATVIVEGWAGRREVKARDFFQPDGICKNVLERGDILARIEVPSAARSYRAGYEKLRLRDSFDFPDGGVAAAVRLDGDIVEDIQVSVTAVSMTPQMFPSLTEPLHGERMTPELIEHLASSVAARTQPVRNVMFPPNYRKRMMGVLTRRLLTRLSPEAAAAA